MQYYIEIFTAAKDKNIIEKSIIQERIYQSIPKK